MVSLIYARTLELPAGLLNESAAMTLMSTDVDRLAISLDSLNEIWSRIVEVVIGSWLLGRQLGWVCSLPIVIVVVSVTVSSLIAKKIGPRHGQWINAIQRRVSITSSMLASMKSLKMMGLSNKLFDVLDDQRIRELDLSKRLRVMSVWARFFCEHIPSVGMYLR